MINKWLNDPVRFFISILVLSIFLAIGLVVNVAMVKGPTYNIWFNLTILIPFFLLAIILIKGSEQ